MIYWLFFFLHLLDDELIQQRNVSQLRMLYGSNMQFEQWAFHCYIVSHCNRSVTALTHKLIVLNYHFALKFGAEIQNVPMQNRDKFYFKNHMQFELT